MDEIVDCSSIKECAWRVGNWNVNSNWNLKGSCVAVVIAAELHDFKGSELTVTSYLKQKNNQGTNMEDVICVKNV